MFAARTATIPHPVTTEPVFVSFEEFATERRLGDPVKITGFEEEGGQTLVYFTTPENTERFEPLETFAANVLISQSMTWNSPDSWPFLGQVTLGAVGFVVAGWLVLQGVLLSLGVS